MYAKSYCSLATALASHRDQRHYPNQVFEFPTLIVFIRSRRRCDRKERVWITLSENRRESCRTSRASHIYC